MRFSTDKAVYPLALTATGGHNTEVLIYLASNYKMSCDGRMTLRYANAQPFRSLIQRGPTLAKFSQQNLEITPDGFYGKMELEFLSSTEPKNFFTAEDFDYQYLCRFKDRLTSAQMKDDLYFVPDSNNEPDQETIWEWSSLYSTTVHSINNKLIFTESQFPVGRKSTRTA